MDKYALIRALLVVWLVTVASGQINFPGFGGFGGGRPIQRPQTPRPHVPQRLTAELSGCNCLPANKCPSGYGQLQVGCILETEGAGICCVPQEGITLTRLGFASSEFQPITLPPNAITAGYNSGVEDMRKLEEDVRRRLSSGKYLKQGSPERGHAYFFDRDPSAVRVHEVAYLLAQTSLDIAEAESLTPVQSFFGLPDVRIGNNLRNFQCPANEVPRCDPNAKYRTIDGSCNNLGNPLMGKSETGFARLSPPLYGDGIMRPRTVGVDGQPLPNARLASSTILLDVDAPDPQFTVNVMQWAQFMDHDLTLVPFPDMNGQAIMCCENGRIVNPLPQQCFPITVPPNDAFYGPRNQQCINFVRSMLALNRNCALGPVEQQNVLTHWVDGSMIYGSTMAGHRRVANRGSGFMLLSDNNLPPVNRTGNCEARIRNTPCFLGGDTRINEQPALTATHTVWVREHNRIAKILQQLNPRWDANTLFEETRRIVIAEVQHITYHEWLPIIIGPSLVRRLGINSLQSGYRNGYNPSTDSRIFNSFASAAFRFGHSLVPGIFRLISNTGRQSTARLRDLFNAPHYLMQNPEYVDSFARSLTKQHVPVLDSFITQELSNHLFQTPEFDFGMDLMSLNLQRGRDHAIATYNLMRPIFGFPRANTFFDLTDKIPAALVKRIQTVYRSVDDIDLFIGGMTEKNLPDALLGPLFANIVGRQFEVLLKGDRFFYDYGGQAGSFTPEQLQEIRKSSMAKVFCDTTNIGEIQAESFRVPSNRNPVKPCDQIPGINLQVFRQ